MLIEKIAQQLTDMVSTIDRLIDGNTKQAAAAEETSRNFEVITKSVSEIGRESENLSGAVGHLAESNKAIVDSIQTISAITEEVSAHSNETFASSRQNQDVVQDVDRLVASLKADAGKLQSASKE